MVNSLTGSQGSSCFIELRSFVENRLCITVLGGEFSLHYSPTSYPKVSYLLPLILSVTGTVLFGCVVGIFSCMMHGSKLVSLGLQDHSILVQFK